MFDRDAHKDEVRPIPNGEFEAIQLEDIPTRVVKIGSMLPFKAIELSEFEGSFKVRKALKAKLFVDFLAKMTLIPLESDHAWVIFTDGLSNIQGSDADIILGNNFGLVEEVSLRSKF
ncbi:hypothetical protein KIW84_051726 [Lathyrus oleraceus]|uniref:Uncharacterized protein n=1 Tax=Pisum sativum TaxID=3888 RepID=A0A9D4WN81_PEA|nr:hypothetical protein KIW84_051726 [Pisum sativum]